MKALVALLLMFPGLSSGQNLADSLSQLVLSDTTLHSQNEIRRFSSYDFSVLWAFGRKHDYNGFAGDSMSRVRVKFCSVRKSSPRVYLVSGFFWYKGHIRQLHGSMTLTQIRLITPYDEGCEDPYPIDKIRAEGIILANFRFSLSDSSSLSGVCSGGWWVDSTNHLHLNERARCSDGFVNNQFAGAFYSATSHKTTKTAWGDYRIPFSGDLDIGAGDFSPNPKYADQGWQSYLDAYEAPQSDSSSVYQTYPEKDSVHWPCSKANDRTAPNTPQKDARH